MAMHMMVVGKPHVVREAGNQEAMDDEESKGRCALEWVVSMSTSRLVVVVSPMRKVLDAVLQVVVGCSDQRTEKLRNARR